MGIVDKKHLGSDFGDMMEGMDGYIMDEDEIKLEPNTENLTKRKSISYGDDEKIKKKDREFDEKKNIAQEVSKYPYIYDITNKGFLDKHLQQTTWEQISLAVGLPVEKCITHWHSLKRSAKYYAVDQKVEYKSGDASDEGTLTTTYRLEWPHRDAMSFYTPPSLRDLVNRKPIKGTPSRSFECLKELASNRKSKAATTATTTATSFNLPAHISAANSPLSNSTAPTDSQFCFGENEDVCYYESTSPSPKPIEEKDELVESVSLMANTLSSYLHCKSVPGNQEKQAPPKSTLKYKEMWANFDRLVSKLDEDAVDDLNIDITNLIGAALKKKRKTS